MDEARQLLCLMVHAQPKLGLDISEQLLLRFHSPDAFWSATRADIPLVASAAVNQSLLELWRAGEHSAPWQQALLWQQQLAAQQITLLSPLDDQYPPLLRDIPGRPGVLYVRGQVAALSLPQLAVVGSRKASRSGLELAQSFARELAASGFAITSGLALGIDTAAHRGALAAAGTTLAVLGTGVDRVYPLRNQQLAQELLGRGALISEFPLGTTALPHHFPRRNRILAGLSLGTLVVEAASRSGSLITARLALDYNREVFAIPGSIHNPNSKGSHRLIREGAKLVETTTDIVEELGGLLRLLHESTDVATASAGARPPLAPHLAAVLEAIDYHMTPFDTIARRSGVSSADLNGFLLELELAQWIEAAAGAWQRCR
jgi:DNA processing protein